MLDVLAQIGAVGEAVIGDLLLAERLPDLVHVHRHVTGCSCSAASRLCRAHAAAAYPSDCSPHETVT